jgi:hypothetical protein
MEGNMFQGKRKWRQPKQQINVTVLAALLHESGRKVDDRWSR